MDVKELYVLCDWFLDHGVEAQKAYQKVEAILKHNASNPQKQPVKEAFETLLSTLRNMPLHGLSEEQRNLLDEEGVINFMGDIGAHRVNNIVKSARFDPATAAADFQATTSSMSNLISKLGTMKESISSFTSWHDFEEFDIDKLTIRIHFKENAAISDVVEWKAWSEEWHDIMRGIALSVDEPPENVKVLGAHQGSIILVLGATAAVTSLLLLISTHLTKIALNGLQVANGLEDFKQKVKLNKAQIEGLEKSISVSEKDALAQLLEDAKTSLPAKIDGGQEAALKLSIKKYQEFTAKGGEVDFISPPEPDDLVGEEELTDDEVAKITGVREDIQQLREVREETLLLAKQAAEDEDGFEDEDLEEEDET